MSNDRPIDPETGNPMSLRDIGAYGASIQRVANLAPGTRYWKIIDAYHLSGRQNRGNHHLFLDMLNTDGTRRYGAKCRVWYGGRSSDLTIDKPANEPGTNAPMYRGNFYDIEGLGMPTDKGIGFGTDHPDEEVGNTIGHHSFMVVFQEAQFDPGAEPTTGSIRGTVVNGAGRTVGLSGGNRSAPVGADGSFGFDAVAPGTYTLTVSGSGVSAQVTVAAGQQVRVTLTVPAEPPPDDLAELRRQVAALQAQLSGLQQDLAEAKAARERLASLLAQIRQIAGDGG